MKQNQPEKALQHLQQHLNANSLHAFGFYQLGNLLRSLDQWPQALCAHLEACRLDPSQSDFYLNLGVTFQGLQQLDRAIQAYDKAYEKDNSPKIRFNRAQALLLSGRYTEGWQEYEWRIRIPEHSGIFDWYPTELRWQGQPFPGQTLLVYHEQGLGDSIQFCRYLPYVKALGGRLVFASKASLLPLLSTLEGVDQVVEHCEATYESLRFQWAVPLMSLPHIFRTTLDSIPNQTPYLSVPDVYRTKWSNLLMPHMQRPGSKNIGFVYACNPENNGHIRTCPLPLWSDLFSIPNLHWFSIQKGAPASAVTELACSQNVTDLTPYIENFADTAALLEQLDLLISVDTSVPHLAGALGKPAWMLLPFANEWRWLLRRSDSPWYPSFRLFRQPGPGKWEPALERIRQALSIMK